MGKSWRNSSLSSQPVYFLSFSSRFNINSSFLSRLSSLKSLHQAWFLKTAQRQTKHLLLHCPACAPLKWSFQAFFPGVNVYIFLIPHTVWAEHIPALRVRQIQFIYTNHGSFSWDSGLITQQVGQRVAAQKQPPTAGVQTVSRLFAPTWWFVQIKVAKSNERSHMWRSVRLLRSNSRRFSQMNAGLCFSFLHK